MWMGGSGCVSGGRSRYGAGLLLLLECVFECAWCVLLGGG